MASDLIKAADDARRLLRGFKAFAEVAEALEVAGQAEQRKLEAETQLAAIQPQIEVAKTDVLIAKGKAKQITADAEEKATKLVAAAEVSATQIVVRAEAEAAGAVKATDNAVLQAKESARAAREAYSQALHDRDALLKECEAHEVRLAKAQASIAKLLG